MVGVAEGNRRQGFTRTLVSASTTAK
jgi:hypothetical protein